MNNLIVVFFFCLLIVGASDAFSKAVEGQEFEGNSLCGSTVSGENPCGYVKEINFHVRGYVPDTDYVGYAGEVLKKWIFEHDSFFGNLNISVQYPSKYGSAWKNRPQIKSKNLEISFYLDKVDEKLIITFVSYSKESENFLVKLCDANNGAKNCLRESINELLETEVFYPLNFKSRK
jgi:hypothetical protein